MDFILEVLCATYLKKDMRRLHSHYGKATLAATGRTDERVLSPEASEPEEALKQQAKVLHGGTRFSVSLSGYWFFRERLRTMIILHF